MHFVELDAVFAVGLFLVFLDLLDYLAEEVCFRDVPQGAVAVLGDVDVLGLQRHLG